MSTTRKQAAELEPGDVIVWSDGTTNQVRANERDWTSGRWFEVQLDTGDVLRFAEGEALEVQA